MYDNIYWIGRFERFAIKLNKEAFLEYEGLNQNDLFSQIKRNTISKNTVAVLSHKVR